MSNPTSPLYGRYLSQAEVTALVAPPPAVVDAVVAELRAHGASRVAVHANRDVVDATLSVAEAERFFGVELLAYRHAKTGRTIIRSAKGHSLPPSIAPYVDLVHGVSDFPVAMRRKPQTGEQALARLRDGPRRPIPSPAPINTAPQVQGAGVAGQKGVVLFTPVCQNGKPAVAMPPCGEADGKVVTNVTLTTSVLYDGAPKVKTTTTPVNCHLGAPDVSCVVNFDPPPYYAYTYVNLSVTYSDGSTSDSFDVPYPLVNSPNIMPQKLSELYSIPLGAAGANASLSQAVGEFEQQYYTPDDLSMFLKVNGIESAPVTLIGPNNPTNPGGEASLDIQYIMAMGRGVATTFWSIQQPSTAPVDHILSYLYQVANVTDPPMVHSLSYGMAAANVDKYQGAGYMERTDAELAKLALRGLTFIIASGDAGVGLIGPAPQEVPNCDVFHPDWPSISPYVTAVGSTYITPLADKACFLPPPLNPPNCMDEPLGEVLLSTDTGMFWTATGGFSFTTATPDYQKAEVAAYLKDHADILPPAHLFNASGRAFPDVVTNGHLLEVVMNGAFSYIDGTSASAPIFAGIVTLLNAARLEAGMAPLGFANPLLYHISRERPGAFRDITVGNNKCSGQGSCCEAGFEATVGFDPATGLGSPNYSVLREAVVQYGCSAAQRAQGAQC